MKALALVPDSPPVTPPSTTMKAIVQDEYGGPDKLELKDVPTPELDDDGVLVRVRAASLNALDWRVMRGHPYLVRMSEGWRSPSAIRGVDLAGVVEAVGKNVTQFEPGDEVYGERGGTLAEYLAGKEDRFAHKPSNLTFEEAAAVPCAALTALQGLRDKAQLKPGQKVLINGAGGGVGTFAVQIAKWLGAEVTAVCGPDKVDLVRSLGADRVVDYAREDFTRGAERYDVLFDIGGNRPLRRCRRVLTPTGTLVFVGTPSFRFVAPLLRVVRGTLRSRFSDRTAVAYLTQHSQADLVVLKELIEAGEIRPVVDRTYSLSDAAEAMRYLESGRARGKIVITI
ncbi:MAG TPA: NAD(P)-dependent alcohol dehydrogenase [Gaiellaceae bacterium]|nr:NAD(P)-dependent alcohol dehydrogenase [Gaiellaceae bacterium]